MDFLLTDKIMFLYKNNFCKVSVKSGSVLTVKNPQTAKAELAACG